MEDDDDGVDVDSPIIPDRKNTTSLGAYRPVVH
jgi:hypothetical protein